MSITVSNRAAERIQQLRQDNNYSDDIKLRVGVVSGGCSGLTYELDFDEKEVNENNDEKLFEDNGIKLIVDMRSFLYLSGTELDLRMDWRVKDFTFTIRMLRELAHAVNLFLFK